jgi:hypothetical protein
MPAAICAGLISNYSTARIAFCSTGPSQLRRVGSKQVCMIACPRARMIIESAIVLGIAAAPDVEGMRSAGMTSTSPPNGNVNSAKSSSKSSRSVLSSSPNSTQPLAKPSFPGTCRSGSINKVHTRPATIACAISVKSRDPRGFGCACRNMFAT